LVIRKASVHRPRGDDHHADQAGRSERGEHTEHQQDAGPDLGERRDLRVHHAVRLHAHAVEPPGGSLQLPAAEPLVEAVHEDRRAGDHPGDEHDGVELGHRERERTLVDGCEQAGHVVGLLRRGVSNGS